MASPDAQLAEVALYETEKVLKQAEALEPATLKGTSKSKLAAQQELEHLQYMVDKKLKLANETIQTKQIEQQYNGLLKQREDTVSVAHLNAMSAVKAQASASQKEVAQMAAQLQDMQLKRAQLEAQTQIAQEQLKLAEEQKRIAEVKAKTQLTEANTALEKTTAQLVAEAQVRADLEAKTQALEAAQKMPTLK
ncbi:MAG: hypothetical protein IPI79_04905 [Moraxellaceae bacterium]|nr:hypothetical protein [Moraxellaceae bacterium]